MNNLFNIKYITTEKIADAGIVTTHPTTIDLIVFKFILPIPSTIAIPVIEPIKQCVVATLIPNY